MKSSSGISKNKEAIDQLLVKDNLSDSVPSENESNREESCYHYLFLSLDIVNSTKIKHQLFNEWSDVFVDFFNETINASSSEIAEKLKPGTLLPWKVLGDEIVFKFRLSSIEQIPRFIEVAEELLKLSSEKVKEAVLDRVEKDGRHTYSTPFTIPDVKATIWHAKVDEEPSKTVGSDSTVCQMIKIPSAQTNYEFIGPDIDIGFRISKAAKKGSIVLDLKIAYLLVLYSEFFESKGIPDLSLNLGLEFYADLKGVWDEKKYPIIFYFPKKSEDCHDSSSDLGGELKRYLKDLELKKSLYVLMEELKHLGEGSKQQDLYKKKRSHEFSHPEFHCVAICFNKQLDSVYIRTRSDGKKDCGCVTLERKQSIEHALVEAYNRYYGLVISMVCDEMDGNPSPIAAYKIEKNPEELINGVIFAAIVDEASVVSDKEVSLVKISSLGSDEGYVPLLKNNIDKAKHLASSSKE